MNISEDFVKFKFVFGQNGKKNEHVKCEAEKKEIKEKVLKITTPATCKNPRDDSTPSRVKGLGGNKEERKQKENGGEEKGK